MNKIDWKGVRQDLKEDLRTALLYFLYGVILFIYFCWLLVPVFVIAGILVYFLR